MNIFGFKIIYKTNTLDDYFKGFGRNNDIFFKELI